MKKLVFVLFFFIIAISFSTEDKVLFLDLEFYSNNTILINNIELEIGEISLFSKEKTDYKIKLLDIKNQTLFESYIYLSFISYPYSTSDLGTKKLEKIKYFLRVPFYNELKYINFYFQEKEIFSLDICNYNRVCEEKRGENEINCNDCRTSFCGNKICEIGENQENCCIDCGCPFGYFCRENKCEPYFSSIVIYLLFLIPPTIFLLLQIKKFKK